MDERAVRQKIFRIARSIGYAPITQTDATKCPRCGGLTKPPIGRPDILLLHPHQASRVIEVKVMHPDDTSFSFTNIDDKQHRWLDWWKNEMGGMGYLGLGIIRPHGQREFLDYLYLIDWERWTEVEVMVSEYQQSIPLHAGKGYRKELQEQNLDILSLFGSYRWMKENGGWHPIGDSTLYGI